MQTGTQSMGGGMGGGMGGVISPRQVEMILEQVDALPTLPSVAARMLRVGASADVDVDEIARLIESDPAMSARILGLCRKSDKGLGDRVTTIKKAVVMLGIEAVRSAVLSVAVCDMLGIPGGAERLALDRAVAEGDDGQGEGFGRLGYWKHCVGVACAAEIIATANKSLKVPAEEAFLAGLLHGVGRLVLQAVLPRAYDRVTRLAARRGVPMASLERAIIGLDHHTAGRRIAARWELPDSIQEVVWLYDQPAMTLAVSRHMALISVINAARALARHLHIGWCGDFGPGPDVMKVWREIGLSGDPMAVGTELHARVGERLKMLGVDETTTPALMMESLAAATSRLGLLNAALETKARVAQWQGRVLDAVCAFQEQTSATAGVPEVIAGVITSARAVLGEGFFAVLVQGDGDEPWRLHQLKPSGGLLTRDIEAPPSAGEQVRLNALGNGQLSVTTLGLLPWLSEFLMDAPDLRSLRLAPIATPSQDLPGVPASALITDRPLDFGPGAGNALRPLVAGWFSAIASAVQHEHARRLDERLVEAGRALMEAQTRLSQREAMARLGETTAGAAHEMNNPLTIISGRAQLLVSRLRDHKDRMAAQQIQQASQQISELITNMHIISSPPVPQPRRCTLGEIVARAVMKAEEKAKPQASVDCVLSRAPQELITDPDLVGAVLSELLANAMEACPKGPLYLKAEVTADQRLVFTVHDNGPGMSPKAMEHAFDPFFSERGAGRGRGLGLTRARTFAEVLAGEVELTSMTGKGTTATFWVRGWRKFEGAAAA